MGAPPACLRKKKKTGAFLGEKKGRKKETFPAEKFLMLRLVLGKKLLKKIPFHEILKNPHKP